MNGLNFEQNISQILKLYLTPKLLQTLRILSLPYTDMVTEIETASEENPFIEIEKHETLTEYLKYLETADKKVRKEVDFRELPGLENVSSTTKGLRECLVEQLRLTDLSEKEMKIAEALVDEIDHHGYLSDYEKIKVSIVSSQNVLDSEVDKVLKIIQEFEPAGVGARDAIECLLLQLEDFGFDNFELKELIEQAIKNHLEDLGNKNFSKVAEALGIEISGAEEIMAFIKTNLNPYPAASFGEESQQVIPSFSIEKDDSKLKLVNLEEKYGPKIVLSADYQKMMKDPKIDANTMKFLKDKLDKAKEMLENISKRGETSTAIMNIILETQKGFFEKGASYMFPLEQKELAEKLGLHPSTISRAISGKYVQTPIGLVPIKLLCPRQFRGFSSQAIKAKIAELISNENKNSPISDEQLKDLLLKEGISMGRRTIASYREELGIKSSSERVAK